MAAMDISSLNKQRSMPSLMPSSFTKEGDDESILGGLTCPVCCEAYSDLVDEKCPRILSNCGHTLCSGTLITLFVNLLIACKNCLLAGITKPFISLRKWRGSQL